jgi:hypothetical protein
VFIYLDGVALAPTVSAKVDELETTESNGTNNIQNAVMLTTDEKTPALSLLAAFASGFCFPSCILSSQIPSSRSIDITQVLPFWPHNNLLVEDVVLGLATANFSKLQWRLLCST